MGASDWVVEGDYVVAKSGISNTDVKSGEVWKVEMAAGGWSFIRISRDDPNYTFSVYANIYNFNICTPEGQIIWHIPDRPDRK